MERCAKALHLRTGDRSADDAITSWLERHQIETVTCRDPFEACAHALKAPDDRPDLIWIGADWLAPDESAVIEYLREVWPAAAIVLHGQDPAIRAEPETERGAQRIRGAAALRRLLADDPAFVLRKLRPTPRLMNADGRGAAPEFVRRAVSTRSRLRDGGSAPIAGPKSLLTETLGGNAAAGLAQLASDSAVATTPPLSQAVLTQEELAALLEDDER